MQIDTLTVNVFGFSRGAAAARHFVHMITLPTKVIENSEGIYALSPYQEDSLKDAAKMKARDRLTDLYGYFGACLVEKELKINKIKFRFAGLYDTVASFGIDHRGKKIGGITIIENDTRELGLDTIGNGKVDFALQIAADDEYRDNFDLTNINSTGLQGLELTLPGVHSDIGGSYANGEEISVLYCKKYDPYDQTTYKECEAFKKIVIDEGWYTDKQLEIKAFYQKDVKYDRLWNKAAGQYYGLVGTRMLYNTYDKIPLNIMFHYSKQFGVEYLDDVIEKSHNVNDSFLSQIYSQLLNYMNTCNNIRNQYVKDYNDGKKPFANRYINDIKTLSYLGEIENLEDLKTLRNQYLHWSVKANQFGLDPRPNNDTPKKEGALESKYRKRNIQDG